MLGDGRQPQIYKCHKHLSHALTWQSINSAEVLQKLNCQDLIGIKSYLHKEGFIWMDGYTRSISHSLLDEQPLSQNYLFIKTSAVLVRSNLILTQHQRPYTPQII